MKSSTLRSATFSLVVVATAALTSACATPHVMLPAAPLASAPLAERDAYYDAKKPAGIAGTPGAENRLGLLTPRGFPRLVLADGTQVADARSLLPAVDPASPTAEAARKVDDLHVISNSIYTVSSLGLGFGAAAAMTSLVLIQDDPATSVTLSMVGLGGTLASAFGFTWALQLAEEAEAEKMTALLLYDADLRRRLALVRTDEVLEKKWLSSAPAASAPIAQPLAQPPLMGESE